MNCWKGNHESIAQGKCRREESKTDRTGQDRTDEKSRRDEMFRVGCCASGSERERRRGAAGETGSRRAGGGGGAVLFA
eukprot:761493-Hanusia_phi.AAC.1